MEFRKATINDMPYIMNIFKQAQNYFKENNIDQWQNNYPSEAIIMKDIKNNDSYVMVENEKIIATIYISFEEDEDYKKIYKGKWISEGDYCVIHRIAVDNTYKGKGIFKNLIKAVEQMCITKNITTIKVDTHEDNLNMQNALKKNGFKYCGIVYVEGGEKRVAFERNF